MREYSDPGTSCFRLFPLFSNCICFLLYDWRFTFWLFDLSKLLHIWRFAFCNSACFLFGFQIRFLRFRLLLKQFASSFGFLLIILRPVYFYFHRFFGCLQIVSAFNFLLWHLCFACKDIAVTDCFLRALRIYLYIGITSLCLYNTTKYFVLQDGKLDKINKRKLCNAQIKLKRAQNELTARGSCDMINMLGRSIRPPRFRYRSSFKSFSLIQPHWRRTWQNTGLSTAGRIKQIRIRPSQSKAVMAPFVPAAMSATQPV